MTLKEQAEELGIKVDGRWSEQRIKEEIEKAPKVEGDDIVEIEPEQPSPLERLAKMKDLVVRQWNGQSPVLPVGERISRIRIAMKHHGYMDMWDKVGDWLGLNDDQRRHL